MEIYLSYEYNGAPFELFGTAYLVTLLVLTLIVLVLIR